MKACGSCGAWIPDDAAVCPNCAKLIGGAPVAPGGSPAVGGPPASGGPPDDADAAHFRRRAEERLRTLGTLYMVAGFVSIGIVALSFYQNATGATLAALDKLQSNPGPLGPDVIRQYRSFIMQPWYLAVTHAVPFLVGVFWAWSGNRLRLLEGRTPALVGAVLLLLPCAGCCCWNLPLGIYALVTLTRADSETVLAGPD